MASERQFWLGLRLYQHLLQEVLLVFSEHEVPIRALRLSMGQGPYKDIGSLVDCQGAQEEPEGRPGGPWDLNKSAG